MRSLLAALALCGIVVAAVPTGASSGSGQATILRVRQPSAGAAANFGDCPDVLIAPVGTVCRESFVTFYRETRVVGGGSNAPSQAPWTIFAATYTLTFPAPEGADPLVTDVIEGTLDNPVASSDDQRVSFATVDAAVPMSDGSTFDFQGTWLGFSERWVYGSN